MNDLAWSSERARGFTDSIEEIWLEVLGRLPELPVGRRWTAQEVSKALAIDVPDDPMPDDQLMGYLRTMALEYSGYLGHPRFYAYITGAGTVPGAAADLLASGLNMNAGGWSLAPSAHEIELHLGRWFAQDVFGLPEGSGGYITSGGAMANFIGLKAARDHKAGWNVREEGLASHPQLVLYLSDETHVVSERAGDELGIGTANVRRIPVDDGYRIDVETLLSQIRTDRAAGMVPFAVVGTAGTVSTGAVDPLNELADVCAREDIWFHVDGAYGGPAMLADDLRPLFRGIERADSIAFDPHKWLYTPHSGGCVVVRRFSDLRDSFDVYASYVVQDKEETQHGIDIGRHGPQFSRSFWALKVWVSLLAHGRSAYARRISHDAELARYLGALVHDRDGFELAAPVGLSICCFRFVPSDLPTDDEPAREAYLSELNHRLMTEIQLDGRVYCSNAILGERFVLRACIVNFRTEAEDMEALLDVASELGRTLDAEMRPEALR